MTKKKANGRQAYCALCGEPVGCGEFCRGCGHHVCGECDETAPQGEHELNDHSLVSLLDDFSELDFNDTED